MRHILKQLTPPILVKIMKALFPSVFGGSDMEYIREGWHYRATHPQVRGWDVPDILEVYKRKWPLFASAVQGTGALGISHESPVMTTTDVHSHNITVAFAYVAAMAAHGRTSISVLDWGGGIGHYYLLARALLDGIDIDYHCKDLARFADYGATVLPDQHFYTDRSCLERSYDLVMASGSLHFDEGWNELLARLAKSTRGYLYLTRVPTAFEGQSFVFVQRPYRYGYNTEYLGWCLARDEVLQQARTFGLTLVREFALGDMPILDAPAECRSWGYLFRPGGESRPE